MPIVLRAALVATLLILPALADEPYLHEETGVSLSLPDDYGVESRKNGGYWAFRIVGDGIPVILQTKEDDRSLEDFATTELARLTARPDLEVERDLERVEGPTEWFAVRVGSPDGSSGSSMAWAGRGTQKYVLYVIHDAGSAERARTVFETCRQAFSVDIPDDWETHRWKGFEFRLPPTWKADRRKTRYTWTVGDEDHGSLALEWVRDTRTDLAQLVAPFGPGSVRAFQVGERKASWGVERTEGAGAVDPTLDEMTGPHFSVGIESDRGRVFLRFHVRRSDDAEFGRDFDRFLETLRPVD